VGVCVNSLAKKLRAITRIAKAAILQALCPKDVGVCVNSLAKKLGAITRIAKTAILRFYAQRAWALAW
jgi:hypothetical protein